MPLLVQGLINGLEAGCLYALIALGLSVIFGVMKTVNFAHGEFLMLGAWGIYYLFGIMGMNFFLAFILTMLILFVIGFGLEKALFRTIRGNMLAGFILTMGLSMILLNSGYQVFGLRAQGVPSAFPGMLHFGTISTSLERVLTAVFALALIGSMFYILRRTKLGRAMRAVSEDSEAATLQGIDLGYVHSMCLGFAVALAGAAGVFTACLFLVDSSMGVRPVSLAFVIIVIGGMGSIPGALFGALIVGLAESFTCIFVSSKFAVGVIFLIGFLMIVIRPRGLMGRA